MLGERIRRLRTGARMTQSELAARLGVSASAVGMYEQGRREPQYPVLHKLSERFGVSTVWLLSPDDNEQEQGGELGEILSTFHKQLRQRDGLMFHGHPLSESDVEKIVRAMRLGAELVLQEEMMP